SLDPLRVRKVVFCSGKVYYDLLAAREANRQEDVALVRVEDLYPFPYTQVAELLARYHPDVALMWCQEEPRNMGVWRWIYGRFLDLGRRLKYAGRLRNASPAAGSPKRHADEQKRLVEEALA
ncbi:MAG: 2-oxoglutarate dehydrogenase E1 component, partial [Bryobacteraceae bacterium]